MKYQLESNDDATEGHITVSSCFLPDRGSSFIINDG